MKYRKYVSKIKSGGAILVLTLCLGACASTGSRQPASVDGAEDDSIHRRNRTSEPAGLRGDFTWLNEVDERFQRETSDSGNRVVASENAQEVLFKQKDWTFSYLPKTNQFYVGLRGEAYKLNQVRFGDGGKYSFAAESNSDKPVTISFAKNTRDVASEGSSCEAEMSYYSSAKQSYVTDRHQWKGTTCARLMDKLKDYVP